MFFTFIFSHTIAQSLDSTAKYIWTNEETKISASVEIFGLQLASKQYCVFYLTNVDTVYNNISDSLFKEFVNRSTLKCPIIKISFYNLLDSTPPQKIRLYENALTKFIVADVQKRFPKINTQNLVITGIDFFAVVALAVAIKKPTQINKAALFFNEEENVRLLNSVLSSAKRLKGKVYLFVNHKLSKDFIESPIEDLANNSSIDLYKFDYFGDLLPSSIFEEAYHWLLAEGNNYIIRNND